MPLPVDDGLRRDLIAARAPMHGIWRAWREGDAAVRMADGFARAVDAESAARHATDLLSDSDWVESIFAPLINALSSDPLFDPPFKVSRDALRVSALIHDCPAASLTATVLSARAMRAASLPMTIVVPGRQSVMRVHCGGGAVLRRWRAAAIEGDFALSATPPCTPLPPIAIADGDVIALDGRRDAMLITDARSDVVTLTATIRLGAAPVMREYARDDGRPLRAATLDEGAARSQMLLSLLRASGRRDAGDAFDAATRDPAFFVRWDAMRQWLAIDADAAEPRLAEMARSDPNADIRAVAAATLAQIARLRGARDAA